MIYLGADHGGFSLKEKMKLWLNEWHMPYQDLGATSLDPTDDYPDIAHTVSESVAKGSNDRGILVCRSGSGMVITANKTRGIRASLLSDDRSARHARTNDDVNVACLAGEWIDDEDAKTILHTFLTTEFSQDERHVRRIKKIE